MICTIVSSGTELLHECKNEYEPPYPEIKDKLRELVWELYCKGCDTFYVNCEYGVPLWTAEIICAMKMYNDITLNIAVPYEEQAVKWCEEYRERYFNVHAKADSVIMANTQYHGDCYKDADEIMLDESNLLAVFGEIHGELYAVNYAKKNYIAVKYFK